MDHKARFDTLKATRDSLWALLEDTQDSLSLIEGQMDEAAQAWAQETGREAQELLSASGGFSDASVRNRQLLPPLGEAPSAATGAPRIRTT